MFMNFPLGIEKPETLVSSPKQLRVMTWNFLHRSDMTIWKNLAALSSGSSKNIFWTNDFNKNHVTWLMTKN